MADDKNPKDGSSTNPFEAMAPFASLFEMQTKAMQGFFGMEEPQGASTNPGANANAAMAAAFPNMNAASIGAGDLAEWSKAATQMQQMWMEFVAGQAVNAGGNAGRNAMSDQNPLDPAQWLMISQSVAKQFTGGDFGAQSKLAQEQFALWQNVMGQFASSASSGGAATGQAGELPRKDRRFADPAWSEHPAFALLHQTYLMLSEHFQKAVTDMKGLDSEKKKQLQFAVTSLSEAMSPGNFLVSNPVVLKHTMETKGQNLVRGMQHLINDLKRGQLTHTDPDAFTLGENLATTPGKVVFETELFQLIQYTPTTKQVYETPLVIFPPWINRFYILDLTAKKSFIKWAVEQGITVFVVSWKSADESMSHVVWDDYIRGQIAAIDTVRERLDVPSVHTIGYCVAGTTLAATLAVLARRDQADKVKSATFFTAQVDFERSGELKNFIDDGQLEMISKLSPQGYVDGRLLAATFNALRGKDLIWNYVVNNYLLGEDYPAFDLLHWNGDVTNLPAKWHNAYLRDLYRDNKLVVPDALEADGTKIDMTRVKTPTYVQAGREDHIAPAQSVWRITDHFSGPIEFLLAGSGHIAGVVNPPAANKYQYWLGDSNASSLDEFVAGAKEHPGSWWPHWLEWLEAQSPKQVPTKGKRKPGTRGDKIIEDAPGRYVKTR